VVDAEGAEALGTGWLGVGMVLLRGLGEGASVSPAHEARLAVTARTTRAGTRRT
jgi:hypothetical protein